MASLLEKARLAPGMQDATPERPVMDRAAMQEAGQVGADLLPLPVDFVTEEGADRAELGFDGLVVEFGGVEPADEGGRAELMTGKMNGNAGHARGAFAANERGGRRTNTSQTQCEPPFFPQPNHPLRLSVLRGRWSRPHHAPPSVGAPTQRGIE